MLRPALICYSVLYFYLPALSQKRSPAVPFPNQFVIARRTFFDFGPPTDFYELFIAKLAATRTSVERISVTPPADMCFAPAKTEVASGILSVMPNELLGPTNPCKIPEKALHREKTRCKHCLTFSGADVVMQVQCGTQSRLIRSAILDRDMFDVAANTPEHTAWTMRLLQRLNSAVGPSGFEKQPIFPLLSVEPLPSRLDSSTMQDLAAGRYDSLFEGAPDKPSDLYRASQIPPAVPEVRLIRSFSAMA